MKIEAKHHKAILLISQGLKNSCVAEELNVAPETVSRWKSDSDFKNQLKAVLQANSDYAQNKLRSLSDMALDTIESIMSDSKVPAKERLTASLKILELNKINAGDTGLNEFSLEQFI